jgi:PEP-CTERM motif-containing protein
MSFKSCLRSLIRVCAVLIGFTLLSGVALADGLIDQNGFAKSFTVSIACPGFPPIVVGVTNVLRPTLSIPPPPVPAACAGSSITATVGRNYKVPALMVSVGGAVVGYFTPPLLPLVTPTSPSTWGTLNISGLATGPDTVLFTGSWSGKDAGVAEQLTWFDLSNPSSPVVLDQLTEVGPFKLPISQSITISSSSGLSNLWLEVDGVAVSTPVPEPASGLLLGSALLGLAGVVRQRLLRR